MTLREPDVQPGPALGRRVGGAGAPALQGGAAARAADLQGSSAHAKLQLEVIRRPAEGEPLVAPEGGSVGAAAVVIVAAAS